MSRSLASPDPATKRAAGLAEALRAPAPILALVLAAGAALHVAFGTVGDVSWLLTVDEKWLAGATPYRDVIEINPPASLLLYWPAVAFAKNVGPSPEFWVAAFGFATSAICLAFAARLARRAGAGPFDAKAVALAAAVAFLLPGRSFDERDVLAAFFGLPLLALWAARAAGASVSLAEALVAGASMGVMIAVKPPYVLVPAAAALYLLLRVGFAETPVGRRNSGDVRRLRRLCRRRRLGLSRLRLRHAAARRRALRADPRHALSAAHQPKRVAGGHHGGGDRLGRTRWDEARDRCPAPRRARRVCGLRRSGQGLGLPGLSARRLHGARRRVKSCRRAPDDAGRRLRGDAGARRMPGDCSRAPRADAVSRRRRGRRGVAGAPIRRPAAAPGLTKRSDSALADLPLRRRVRRVGGRVRGRRRAFARPRRGARARRAAPESLGDFREPRLRPSARARGRRRVGSARAEPVDRGGRAPAHRRTSGRQGACRAARAVHRGRPRPAHR